MKLLLIQKNHSKIRALFFIGNNVYGREAKMKGMLINPNILPKTNLISQEKLTKEDTFFAMSTQGLFPFFFLNSYVTLRQ